MGKEGTVPLPNIDYDNTPVDILLGKFCNFFLVVLCGSKNMCASKLSFKIL
jgi:hypothetical protein